MTELFFVDTNVFVYARDRDAGEKRDRAQHWLRFLWQSQRGRISSQVLSEYFVVASKMLGAHTSEAILNSEIRELLAWHPVAVSAATVAEALEVRAAHRFSWWDCLIVASAVEQQASYVLTEDLQAGFQYRNIRVANPFVLSPEKVSTGAG